jgi:hypothetical protein
LTPLANWTIVGHARGLRTRLLVISVSFDKAGRLPELIRNTPTAIICRICKNRAGIYTQTGAIGVLDARNHFLICRGLSDAQRSTFRAALWKVDLDFVKKEVDNGAKFRHLKSLLEPVDTSSIPLPNFRHKKFTALSSESLDQEEALRTLRADGRLVQWRSRAPSTVDGDAPTAQQDDLTVLRYSIEEEETDEGASISDDRG